MTDAVPGSPGAAASQATYRTFIYGSCVARDTVEFSGRDTFRLSAYVARQSLISAVHRADPARLAGAALESRFQRRMLEGDAGSSLWTELEAKAADTELVLCDLTDERLGVYQFADGSCVTRSLELIRSGLEDDVAEQSRLLPFGSDEHFTLWRAALQTLSSRLAELGLRERTLFLLVPWATVDTSGNRVTGSFGTEPAAANDSFVRYNAAVIESFPGQTIALEPEDVRADPDHRWGPAPFHYDDATYAAIGERVDAWLRANPSTRAVRARQEADPPGGEARPARTPVLRQVAPGAVVVEAGGPGLEQVAFHLYRGTTKVRQVGYGKAGVARFDDLPPGAYSCRVYYNDPSTGARTGVTTDRLVLESVPTGPALLTPPRSQVAVVGVDSTAVLLGLVLAHHHDVVGFVSRDDRSGAEVCGLPVVRRSEVPPSATILDPADVAHSAGPDVDGIGLPSWQRILDRELGRLVAMQMYRIARRLYLAGAEQEAKLIEGRIYRDFGCVLPCTAHIGEGTRLGYGGIGTVVHASAVIGKSCVIGHNVTIGARAGAPRIGDGVLIGAGTVCLAPEVGAGAVIGAGSVVLESVEAGAVVAGNPARGVSASRAGADPRHLLGLDVADAPSAGQDAGGRRDR